MLLEMMSNGLTAMLETPPGPFSMSYRNLYVWLVLLAVS